jgi:hypothetical protein
VSIEAARIEGIASSYGEDAEQRGALATELRSERAAFVTAMRRIKPAAILCGDWEQLALLDITTQQQVFLLAQYVQQLDRELDDYAIGAENLDAIAGEFRKIKNVAYDIAFQCASFIRDAKTKLGPE